MPQGDHAITDDDVARHQARTIARLAPGIAHDLINQVGGIRQFLPLVLGDVEERDQRMLRDSADRALETVTAFQQLVRPRTARPGSERLDRLVGSVRTLLAYELASVAITDDLPPESPEVDGVTADLRQAILAVLLDRLAAMGSGPAGRLRFALSKPSAGPGTLDLAIEDDGPAASVDSLDITVARHLLERSGGALRSEPPAAGGSRVVLTMRVTGAAQAPDAGDAAADTSQTTRAPAVLVCDDDPSILSLISRVLQRDGIAALQAVSGAAAMHVLATNTVDVVLADHRLGGMTAPELYLAAIALDPRLVGRFVLMSGDAGDADLDAFAREHDLRVLAKPFTVSLAEVVREVGQRG